MKNWILQDNQTLYIREFSFEGEVKFELVDLHETKNPALTCRAFLRVPFSKIEKSMEAGGQNNIAAQFDVAIQFLQLKIKDCRDQDRRREFKPYELVDPNNGGAVVDSEFLTVNEALERNRRNRANNSDLRWIPNKDGDGE